MSLAADLFNLHPWRWLGLFKIASKVWLIGWKSLWHFDSIRSTLDCLILKDVTYGWPQGSHSMGQPISFQRDLESDIVLTQTAAWHYYQCAPSTAHILNRIDGTFKKSLSNQLAIFSLPPLPDLSKHWLIPAVVETWHLAFSLDCLFVSVNLSNDVRFLLLTL